jgi:hypothetical protein
LWYLKIGFVVFYYKVLTIILTFPKIMCLTMKSFSLEFLSLGSPKSDNHVSKPTRIQNSNLQCSMISPYPKCLVHPKPCNHFTPLTLPLQYFGFRPWNPCEMTENELKAFCNLLSICLLQYSLYSLNLFNSY